MTIRTTVNNFITTTTADINNTDLSVSVTSVTGGPSLTPGTVECRATLTDGINYEIVILTDLTSLTYTITRGAEGSTAQSWPAGTKFTVNLTADSVDRKADGASSSTDNALARYDGTTGKVLQNSGITTDDDGNTTCINFIDGYTTTATAASTTTLTNASTYQQWFTGSTTQNCKLPVVSTLKLGQAFFIANLSSGSVTIQSSGSNTVQVLTANTSCLVVCISLSGTGAASWAIVPGNIAGVLSLTGTSNQITVSAATGAITISIPNNPTLPGTGGVIIPQGSTASRPGAGNFGRFRANTSTGNYELDDGSAWRVIPDCPETNTAKAIPVFNNTNDPSLIDSGVTIQNSNIKANNNTDSLTSTATSAGTLTLTVSSTKIHLLTGSTTHTVTLPVTSTLTTGHSFIIMNKSSGVVTVQSSGANTLQAMASNTVLVVTCISTSGTGTSSWEWWYLPIESGITGSGNLAMSASPTFTGTLTAAAIVGTSINVGQNDLNYLEQGTWTPILTCASPGTLSVSYGTQSGVYFRINDLLILRCNLTYTPTQGTASGNVRITGAPYPIAGTIGLGTPVLNSAWTWPASTTTPVVRAITGQTYFELYGSKSGASLTNFAITDGADSTATQWNFAGFYYI